MKSLVGDDRGLLPKGLPPLATCKRLFPEEKEPGVGSFAIHGASLGLNPWGTAVTAIQRSPATPVAHLWPVGGVTRWDLSLWPLQLFSSVDWVVDKEKQPPEKRPLHTPYRHTHTPSRQEEKEKGPRCLGRFFHTCYLHGAFSIMKYR